ncbi:hypothetical protein DUNSADRAFT_1013 [Dunaliella salina]|uniref:Encoded protein n=1 Tax=Dunaliella salina TaxID=3046 RepID=A0ABQ7FY22_DUNSA|nr:hypothetical protein DUNSADRAFT_1013 [Dunaliella salina]|eukprot:KAF5827268.1 hypothetical protein DUNSADRAFT_1013 [Dunaliella salina]
MCSVVSSPTCAYRSPSLGGVLLVRRNSMPCRGRSRGSRHVTMLRSLPVHLSLSISGYTNLKQERRGAHPYHRYPLTSRRGCQGSGER